jgi:hypothetical protein
MSEVEEVDLEEESIHLASHISYHNELPGVSTYISKVTFLHVE